MSVVLRGMLDRGELDAAIVRIVAHEVRPTDVVLFREGLHWVKLAKAPLPGGGPIPFPSFDDQCLYRQWAMDIVQDYGALLETVIEHACAAGTRDRSFAPEVMAMNLVPARAP